jgi:hypothetical protein
VLASLSLFESTMLGYVFGVNVRVLSVMIVFFLMGLAIVVFPRSAPALYRANTSGLRNNRAAQIATGTAIMAFTLWFGVSIIYGARTQALWLQPAVQAVIVAAIGVLILRSAERRRAPAAAAADTARPGI